MIGIDACNWKWAFSSCSLFLFCKQECIFWMAIKSNIFLWRAYFWRKWHDAFSVSLEKSCCSAMMVIIMFYYRVYIFGCIKIQEHFCFFYSSWIFFWSEWQRQKKSGEIINTILLEKSSEKVHVRKKNLAWCVKVNIPEWLEDTLVNILYTLYFFILEVVCMISWCSGLHHVSTRLHAQSEGIVY